MRELPVTSEAIIAALRRRIDQLIYENAMLQAAVDQMHAGEERSNDEAQGRGTLPGLAVDFTDSHDSSGQPWQAELTIGVEPGTDLLAMLINLADQGVCDWAMQGRTLRVWNEGTALSRQLAAGAAPVELRLGRDIDQAPDDATLEDAASSILGMGEESLNVEVTNPSAVMPWGRWEAAQSQGGVADEGTARFLAQIALERAAGERVQLTRQLTPYRARFLPLADYRAGDFVRAPGDQAQLQSLRVRQVTLSVDSSGVVGGNLTLNDRFLEADIRRARQAAGIVSGGVSTGGNGGEPAPDSKDRVPAAPTGLIVNPQAFQDDEGFTHGVINVSWTGVTTDINGTALTVDGYQLLGQTPPGTGAMRILATTTGTSVAFSPLVPRTQWVFAVRATNQGTLGVPASSATITIPDDETPPPDPSTPAVDSRLGIFRITWDGLSASGTGMPKDFTRVLIMMKDPLDSEDVGTPVEWLERAGTAVVAGDGRVQTIEGNTGDACRRRVRAHDVIAGFWNPPYTKVKPQPKPEAPEPEANPTEVMVRQLPLLVRGSKGWHVKSLFYLLHARGYGLTGNIDDTVFGAPLEEAVKAFQKAAGLKSDGECGPKTWAALLKVA
ncbi:peptidoglycan-binding protein [Nonomuraea sp. NPDC050663]|uniref:peptidoglycan-binding protein n=1 Tax=Nonomuraea sp. NPDC050663 TaxID=3364370 RepID=UPI0037989045